MRLIVVRHGETASNVGRALDTGYPGAPLSERGAQQAVSLVERLADQPIDAIYTSDYTRAIQTAQPLANDRGITSIAHPGFREIFAGEHDMSQDWQPYIDTMMSWVDDPSASLPGGESFLDLIGRWQTGLAQIESGDHEVALLVTHGAAIRSWVPYAATNISQRDVSEWELPNTTIIVLDGSSEDVWTLRSWGEHQPA